MSKQYGLILAKDKGHKIAPVTVTRPSIFNDDSDSDTPDLKPTGMTKSIKKQDKLNQNKAIEQDPTVYQYDEIYDEMDQRRKESKLSRTDLDKKPKYISRLLAAAEKRKRENERRIERQVQKEREEEGEQFKDKESFVTSAYKKKLEELQELEEQEKREEYLESIGDVRKQGNLDGFYRHLYDQKVNYEDKGEGEQKKENTDIKVEPKTECVRDGDEEENAKRKSCDSESESEKHIKPKKDVKKRKYRARRESEDKSDEESDIKKEHLPSNLDADSDFSIDSSDSEEEKEEKEVKASKAEVEVKKENETDLNGDNKDNKAEEIIEDQKTDKVEETIVEVKVKKIKVDIWKKRTVGEKFDEALKRYFERKALREAGL